MSLLRLFSTATDQPSIARALQTHFSALHNAIEIRRKDRAKYSRAGINAFIILADLYPRWLTSVEYGRIGNIFQTSVIHEAYREVEAARVTKKGGENIVGGFTHADWELRKWSGKIGKVGNRLRGHPSLKSFLFTLKNPRNVSALRFTFEAERKHEAICWDSCCGPHFADICVFDKCDANSNSYISGFGERCTDDTGLVGNTFFINSLHFQTKEIEIIEITD
jgi:hypothetical protein